MSPHPGRSGTEEVRWPGHYTRRHQEAFENAFATYTGAKYALCVNSGGVALDIAMACLDAEPGAEVVSCALNFPGTHLSVLGAGLRLVLAEPEAATLNLDPAEVPWPHDRAHRGHSGDPHERSARRPHRDRRRRDSTGR